MALAPGESFSLVCERINLEPFVPGRKDRFYVSAAPKTRKVVISDADTGTVLSLAKVRRPMYCDAMSINVKNPWRKQRLAEKTLTVSVEVCLALPAEALKKGTLQAALVSRETGKRVADRRVPHPGPQTRLTFRTRDLPWGAYDVRVAFRNASGQEITSSVAPAMVLPGGKHQVKVLNNLVSELANAEDRGMLKEKEIAFMNPRDGWVYCYAAADVGKGGRLSVSVAGSPETRNAIVLSGKGDKTGETMRFLSAGKHKVVLNVSPRCRGLKQLIVRAIPEIVYAQYGANPHTREFGPYAGEFEEKYVVKNINTYITSDGTARNAAVVNAWKRRGGKWLVHCGVPTETEGGPLTVESATRFVAGTPGYSLPLVDGSIADEFGNSQGHCRLYAMAVRRLKGRKGFESTQFYPYANHLYTGPEGQDLMQAMIDTGSNIAYKRYLRTRPDVESANAFLKEELIDHAVKYRELCPGSHDHIVVCFGIFSAPNEFLSSNPSANYKTYLDMQFNIVANHPAFWRTYGLMSYLSSYADEETIRWTCHLFRHYGIEGRAEHATKDPYDLNYVQNPDFEDGTRGWTLKPAAKSSIRHVHSPGFGWLQGRYPRTEEGDRALLLVRNAQRPNVFTQKIKNLKPGRLYSFRMFSGDFKDMSKKEKHAVTLKLENVTLLPKKCFTSVIANCYSHAHPPYDRNHKAWMNYHWRILRAKGRTARVTVTDWASEKEPGGPIGQELMFNYISVQPYFSE